MPVATQRSSCMRLLCTLFTVQWKPFGRFVLYFGVGVTLLSLSLSDNFNGWSQLSLDAAFVSAFLGSAYNLFKVLAPILYRELGFVRWIGRKLRLTKGGNEDQMSVLKIISHLPQLTPVTDKHEQQRVQNVLQFRTPGDHVYCLTSFPSRSFHNNSRADVALLPVPGFQIPSDPVVFRQAPELLSQLVSNLRQYKVAASRRDCLRCFLLFLNAKNHYLVDELDQIYTARNIWLPPDTVHRPLLLYGELFVETTTSGEKHQLGHSQLVFEVVCGVPLQPDQSMNDLQLVIATIMNRKSVKDKQNSDWEEALKEGRKRSCWRKLTKSFRKEVAYYNDYEPFSLRTKAFQMNACEEQAAKDVLHRRLEDVHPTSEPGSGLVFVPVDEQSLPTPLVHRSTWVAKSGGTADLLSLFYPRNLLV